MCKCVCDDVDVLSEKVVWDDGDIDGGLFILYLVSFDEGMKRVVK